MAMSSHIRTTLAGGKFVRCAHSPNEQPAFASNLGRPCFLRSLGHPSFQGTESKLSKCRKTSSQGLPYPQGLAGVVVGDVLHESQQQRLKSMRHARDAHFWLVHT